MPYSPESLQAFVEAAALGSFSAAARRLRKTQSTVSTAIAHLEADLGMVLFDRSGRYPQLTDAGRQVLGHAQGQRLSERATEARSQSWRPWRAYAVLHLWHLSGTFVGEPS